MLPFLLALHVHGVVDRIEGDVAVIEWERRNCGPWPLARLPEGIDEGHAIDVYVPLSREAAPFGVVPLHPVHWTTWRRP
jgi:hypothetical protein